MTRKERLLPNGIPRWIRCYDNGGETFDRYTVVYTGHYKDRNGCDYVGMSEYPFSPQGFGQHGWDRETIDRPAYAHLGRKVSFANLPEDCRRLVMSDYREIWSI